MAKLCGVEVAALRATTYGPPSKSNSVVYQGSPMPRLLVSSQSSTRRICPDCLREDLYHRSCWDLEFADICPIHRVLLCTRCQACGRGLRWAGSTVSRCKCGGADFRKMTAPAIEDRQVTATAGVMGLLGDGRYSAEAASLKSLAPFTDLDPGEIGDFLLRISPSALRRQAVQFTLSWVRSPSTTPHEVLTAGLEMAREWPERFYAAIGMPSGGHFKFVDPTKALDLLGAIELWVAKKMGDGRGLIIADALQAYRRGCQLKPTQRPFVHLRSG